MTAEFIPNTEEAALNALNTPPDKITEETNWWEVSIKNTPILINRKRQKYLRSVSDFQDLIYAAVYQVKPYGVFKDMGFENFDDWCRYTLDLTEDQVEAFYEAFEE